LGKKVIVIKSTGNVSNNTLINISDITGKSVFEHQSERFSQLKINMSGESAGLYLIRILNNQNIQTKKIIIH